MATRLRILSRMFTSARSLFPKGVPIVKEVLEDFKVWPVASVTVYGGIPVNLYNAYMSNKQHQELIRMDVEYDKMLTRMEAERHKKVQPWRL